MGVTLRLILLLISVIGFSACGARALPQASTQAGIEPARSSSGYRVFLRDGTNEFIADPSRYELKGSSDGPMLALRGRGFELAIKASAVRRFTRFDAKHGSRSRNSATREHRTPQYGPGLAARPAELYDSRLRDRYRLRWERPRLFAVGTDLRFVSGLFRTHSERGRSYHVLCFAMRK